MDPCRSPLPMRPAPGVSQHCGCRPGARLVLRVFSANPGPETGNWVPPKAKPTRRWCSLCCPLIPTPMRLGTLKGWRVAGKIGYIWIHSANPMWLNHVRSAIGADEAFKQGVSFIVSMSNRWKTYKKTLKTCKNTFALSHHHEWPLLWQQHSRDIREVYFMNWVCVLGFLALNMYNVSPGPGWIVHSDSLSHIQPYLVDPGWVGPRMAPPYPLE